MLRVSKFILCVASWQNLTANVTPLPRPTFTTAIRKMKIPMSSQPNSIQFSQPDFSRFPFPFAWFVLTSAFSHLSLSLRSWWPESITRSSEREIWPSPSTSKTSKAWSIWSWSWSYPNVAQVQYCCPITVNQCKITRICSWRPWFLPHEIRLTQTKTLINSVWQAPNLESPQILSSIPSISEICVAFCFALGFVTFGWRYLHINQTSSESTHPMLWFLASWINDSGTVSDEVDKTWGFCLEMEVNSWKMEGTFWVEYKLPFHVLPRYLTMSLSKYIHNIWKQVCWGTKDQRGKVII